MFLFYCYAFLTVSVVLNLVTLCLKNNLEYLRGYTIVNISPEQSIMHVNFNFVNIYAPQLSYYDILPLHFAWLDNYLFDRFPDFDANHMLQNKNFVYLDYLPEKNKVPTAWRRERFVLSEENIRQFEPITRGLYRRKDIIAHD